MSPRERLWYVALAVAASGHRDWGRALGGAVAVMKAPYELLPHGVEPYPDGTIEIQPCDGCGTPTFHVLEIESPSWPVILSAFVCRCCQQVNKAELGDLRAVFESYLHAGISRATANKLMVSWHVRPGMTS